MSGDGGCRAAPYRYWRVLVLALAALVVPACSTTQLFYNNLDWLAYRRLDAQFEIRPDQREAVRERLAQLHAWHRETQLPAYRQTLLGLLERHGAGLQADDFAWLEARLQLHRQAFIERALPDLAWFLADLDAAQRRHFAAASTESLAEAAEPLALDREGRLERRLELFRDRIEPWTGRLRQEQVAALRGDLAVFPDWLAAWIGLREERTRELERFLATHPPAPRIERLLANWFDYRRSAPGEYLAAREAAWRQTWAVVLRLDARLAERQRRQVQERLQEYIAHIDALTNAG